MNVGSMDKDELQSMRTKGWTISTKETQRAYECSMRVAVADVENPYHTNRSRLGMPLFSVDQYSLKQGIFYAFDSG